MDQFLEDILSTSSLGYFKAGRIMQLLAILQLVTFSAAIIVPVVTAQGPVNSFVYLMFLTLIIPVLTFFLGKAIKAHADWSRVVGIIYSGILLIGFPIGTVIGAYLLWLLIKGWE